jgi:coenzyme F420-0:L-glutamate ligase/coenzyme F420-1:gamma-L-glutamate ligase
VGVVVVDSIGRAWRNGIVGHAIGVAGITALLDLRGAADRQGRTLRVTEVALADEIAAAGSLLMGQAAEGKPVVVARGFRNIRGDSTARSLLRNREFDLFR